MKTVNRYKRPSSLLQVPLQLWGRNTETHAGTQVSWFEHLTPESV